MVEKRRGASPQSTCRAEGNPGPEKPKNRNVQIRNLAVSGFQTEVFPWTSARDAGAKMLVFFPGLGGPDRSFLPDVRRDIWPKTSTLG